MSSNTTSSSTVQDLSLSLDTVWLFLASVLVFLMQTGFTLVEVGCVSIDNVKSILFKNLADLVMGSFAWILLGYGIAFGDTIGGFMGTSLFLGEDQSMFFFYQMMFACTAATIDSGAVAGRMELFAYMLSSFYISVVLYPIIVHWVWSEGGFLFNWGYLDFAGASVVHLVGGICGLVGAVWIGPRTGRFDEEGVPNEVPGHSLVLSSLGTWLLFFGWFGFNAGSTLSVSDNGALATQVSLNTFYGGLAGCLVAIFLCKAMFGKYDIGEGFNAMLGGLCSITGSCSFISLPSSIIIGAIGGLIYTFSAGALLNYFKVDDPVNAFSVHGSCGFWSIISVGLFHKEEGLFTAGKIELLGIQLAGLAAIVSFTLLLITGFYWVAERFIHHRVSLEVELVGCDCELSGSAAYYMVKKQKKETVIHVFDVMFEEGGEARSILKEFFSEKEMTENFMFYVTVLKFEIETAEAQESLKDAAGIYHKFVKKNAEQEVNLPGWMVQQFELHRNSPHSQMFEEPKQEVHRMMTEAMDQYFHSSSYVDRYEAYKESLEDPPLLGWLGQSYIFSSKSKADPYAVDKTLEAMREAERLTFKVLFLGAGESGKSTLLKQIGKLFNSRLTTAEILAVSQLLRRNALNTMSMLLGEADKRNIALTSPQEVWKDQVLSSNVDFNYAGDAVLSLWQSEPIQKIWSLRADFWHLESGYYFCESAVRFMDTKETTFSPTLEDQLRVRSKTSGVQIKEYKRDVTARLLLHTPAKGLIKDPSVVTWNFVDVGGQKSERRKWMGCFDNVHVIIYVVNLAGYNSVIYEDGKTIRLQESLELCEATFKDRFVETPVCIMFNKVDIFRENFDAKALDRNFPQLHSPETADEAIKGITQMFIDVFQPVGRDVKYAVVNALSTTNVRNAFANVQNTVIVRYKYNFFQEDYCNQMREVTEEMNQKVRDHDVNSARGISKLSSKRALVSTNNTPKPPAQNKPTRASVQLSRANSVTSFKTNKVAPKKYLEKTSE